MKDSDTDKEDSISKLQSKIIGKPKKNVIDNNGYRVKQDNEEKLYINNDDKENPFSGWDFTRPQSPAELFMPLFIGKELKPGDSYPYLDSFTVERKTTSFSINKEKMDTRDSGTYTITGIENAIASISYIGTNIFSILMNIMGKPTNSISRNIVRAQIQIDINTGIVVSKITEEEKDVTIYLGDSDKPTGSTNKNTTTIKVKLIL